MVTDRHESKDAAPLPSPGMKAKVSALDADSLRVPGGDNLRAPTSSCVSGADGCEPVVAPPVSVSVLSAGPQGGRREPADALATPPDPIGAWERCGGIMEELWSFTPNPATRWRSRPSGSREQQNLKTREGGHRLGSRWWWWWGGG